MNLRGSHVVVTGASRGLGAALSRELAGNGARLTLLGRNADALQRIADETAGHPLAIDLSSADELDGLIDRIEDLNGPIDGLVNNAAMVIPGSFATRSAADVRVHMNTNLIAPIELTRQVLPKMLSRCSGSIVTVSSIVGEVATCQVALYATSKGALTQFCANLRRELRNTPVKLTLMILGAVRTDMLEQSYEDPYLSIVAKRLGRVGLLAPEFVAEKIVDAMRRDKAVVVLPRGAAGTYHLRQLPARLTDLVMAGLARGPVPPNGSHHVGGRS